ncbi:MAG: hypothetical protein H6697_03090 [Myxococcales bacterium]|nr:hypothetical protein [Myxococcales bacterium]MCB9520681.1 hypothetical protein [Myxococcales bacterium]
MTRAPHRSAGAVRKSAVRRAALAAPLAAVAAAAAGAGACGDSRLYDERGMTVGYRSGTVDDGYLSSGERGTVVITEVNWAGSVEKVEDGYVHDASDVFIELRNQHYRPVHLTGWTLEITVGDDSPGAYADGQTFGGEGHWSATYTIPPRENGHAVDTNEYVVVAARRDGAFADADYFIEDLALPVDRFEVTLRDLDRRLIESAGNVKEPVFGGAWDLVTARSMERTQLIFSNDGGRNASWHTYAFNAWDGSAHDALRARIAPEFRERTFASPGLASSPDYSGNTSAGSFE